MMTFVSLAAAMVVSISVSGSPASPGQPDAIHASVWLASDCDQGAAKDMPRFVIPRLELRVKPTEKKIAPEEEGSSGFCAMTSGPLGDSTECRFQLLA